MSAELIAKSLTPGQQRALDAIRHIGVHGMRPGHNVMPELEYYRPGSTLRWNATELDSLYRLGLADAYPSEEHRPIQGEHREMGKMEADHRWHLTPLGLEVRAILADQEQSA